MKFVDSNISKLISELLEKQDHETQVVWAVDCAGHVLANFTGKYPEDNRPEMAVKAGYAWVQGKITVGEARNAAFAAHASARNAEKNAAACAAARAAGQAVSAAHAAGHAVHAATYAAKSAFYAAEIAIHAVENKADSDTEANAVVKEEREWQYQHLLELKNFDFDSRKK